MRRIVIARSCKFFSGVDSDFFWKKLFGFLSWSLVVDIGKFISVPVATVKRSVVLTFLST